MLEKSTCRSETVYWWKLVVEAANWSPFLPPVRIMFINILCFLTKNFELEENVVLLEVLYRHVDCVDIYDFIHLLTYYQLCINFQKKKNLKMNSVQILWGFFVCVYKAKNMVHLMEEMPQSLELVPFFPPIFFESALVFFSIFNMKTTCYNTNDHYNCNVVDFHWVFNSFLNLVVWFFSLYTIFLKNDCLSQFCCILFIGYSCHGVCQVLKKKIYPMLSTENVVVQETKTNLLCCYGCI